ncbi:hypothetical protein GQ43DRAFT_372497 [Delitschia confertaspora ATCC 74209]|uniref:Myb-like domain-containing protein n=1 Tax=Delitschia confertaspora ATCC 74209 TaxID=1513339 RepID=A0A9P4MSH6_9PLEO|nr:hypothetical protein GQ43DRAFT_372497 [Delitschia confertaspora ATCC 74209]
MSAVLEGAVPPPLGLNSKSSWAAFSPLQFSCAPTSSPVPMTSMSPEYMPHLSDVSLPPQDMSSLATSGWYGSPVPAPTSLQEPAYPSYGYDQAYATPLTSSSTFSPPTSAPADFSNLSKGSPLATFSPVSHYSRLSDHGDFKDHYPDAPKNSIELPLAPHLQLETNPPARPRSSPSTFAPNQDLPWAMNPLGISTPPMHPHLYASSPYIPLQDRNPRLSEPAMDIPSDLATPQPRRMYAPIAPHPVMPRTSHPKRARDDDECSEQGKRRKRSDSNTSMQAIDLGEEDRLLIKLKDEESMPWKDIAQRFQTDLGKTYQIPALQMRLKRLRERMRVWTETDVKALRMAHEYWVQSKFDIISQKMLEYGAAEKWTARQCARKWAEIDPGPTPYTTYDHSATSYAPYSMSPVEAPPYLSYMHIP